MTAKEILKKIKSISNFDDYVDFIGTEFKPLLDYITNLQQENERLSKEVDMWNKKYNEQFDIINELEKYLIEHKEVDWDARDTIIHEALAISFVYDILQDLKEGNFNDRKSNK